MDRVRDLLGVRTTPDWGGANRLLGYAVSVSVLAVAGAAMAGELLAIDPDGLVRDPAAYLDAPGWLGALSYLGGVLWVIGAAIAIFVAGTHHRSDPHSAWLYAAGIYTAVLAFDDIFMFHDAIAPDLLGFPDRFVAPIYLLVGAALALRFRTEIAASTVLPGIVAVLMFALSLAFDVLADNVVGHDLYFPEDAFKLVGIAAWAAYLVILAVDVDRGRWSLFVDDREVPADGRIMGGSAPDRLGEDRPQRAEPSR